MASLINDLDALAGPTVLALDDYHVIDNPEVHQVVAFLLDHLPPQVTLAMTTRADPPLPLSRLRARGELLEVRAADLRFTAEEADVFLNQVMDLRLAPGHVAALEARTEGWAAGLQLAALSARGHINTSAGDPATSDGVAAFVEAFTGSHRFVLDYLLEEVLATQPEERRDFSPRYIGPRAADGRLVRRAHRWQRRSADARDAGARQPFSVLAGRSATVVPLPPPLC